MVPVTTTGNTDNNETTPTTIPVERSSDQAPQLVTWGDPPPPQYGLSARKGVWHNVYELLRTRPGEWARWPRPATKSGTASVFAAAIKKGKHAGVKEGEFEAVSRKVGVDHNGTSLYGVWARYVGGGAS